MLVFVQAMVNIRDLGFVHAMVIIQDVGFCAGDGKHSGSWFLCMPW